MTTFEQFFGRTRLRHDYADQIQARYTHPDGDDYDTWVSGEEALSRLRSDAAGRRLKGLSRLDLAQLKDAARDLPAEGRKRLHDRLQAQLGDAVEASLSGSVIGDSLSDAVRGRDSDADPRQAGAERWQALLQDEAFRAKVLELAWINLRGSFPDEPAAAPGDWV